MRQWTVRDVMTAEVLTMDYDTPPAEVVTMMTTHDVSAVAIVDDHDSVVGIVTRTDVLNSMEMRAGDGRSRVLRRRPGARPAWTARSGGQMMSAPALTVGPDATLGQAGRVMRRHHVNRLLVAGPDRRLLGIVSATDLLKVHDRSDEVVRAEVRQALARLPAADVAVGVHDGVATIAGVVPDARTAALLPPLVHDVPGVSAIHNQVAIAPAAAAARPAHEPIDGWWPARRPQTGERTPAEATK